jgi:hypothetical protein
MRLGIATRVTGLGISASSPPEAELHDAKIGGIYALVCRSGCRMLGVQLGLYTQVSIGSGLFEALPSIGRKELQLSGLAAC